MNLEAIAALLGHQTKTMIMAYARIASRAVADKYFTVTAKVQALYDNAQAPRLHAFDQGRAIRHLHTQSQRLLGNGCCARQQEVGCHYDIICEGCTFSQTTIEFRPTLQRQRDDAEAKGQTAREAVFRGLLDRLDETGS